MVRPKQDTVEDPIKTLAALPGLGPTSARMLAEAGVGSIDALRRLGPVGAYRRLRFHFGRRVTLNFLYALECALRDLDWRRLEPARKLELKAAAKAIQKELEKSAVPE